MLSQNILKPLILIFLVLSVTPVSAYEYQQLNQATEDLYKEDGVRVTVTQYPNNELLQYSFIEIFLNLVNSDFKSIYKNFILISNDGRLENLIDGSNETSVFVTQDISNEYHVYKSFDPKNWKLITLNIKDAKNYTNVQVMKRIKGLYHNESNTVNTSAVLSLSQWLSYHMSPYERMNASNKTWDELTLGMIAIIKNNETFLPCLIKNKTKENIVV